MICSNTEGPEARICPDCGAHLDPGEICDCRWPQDIEDDPCADCLRWSECIGVDRANCPLCRR